MTMPKKEKSLNENLSMPENPVSQSAYMQKLLTEKDAVMVIEFSGLSPEERVRLLKNRYRRFKKEYDNMRILTSSNEPETFVRKSYWLKSEVASTFAEHAKKEGIEIGKYVTSLLLRCIQDADSGKGLPSPAVRDENAAYESKSYKVMNAAAARYSRLCNQNHFQMGAVL